MKISNNLDLQVEGNVANRRTVLVEQICQTMNKRAILDIELDKLEEELKLPLNVETCKTNIKYVILLLTAFVYDLIEEI